MRAGEAELAATIAQVRNDVRRAYFGQVVAEQRPELLLPVVEFVKAKKHPAALLEKKGRRVYLAYPHFRDAAAGIPDSVYLAEPRQARAYPGYRDGGADSFVRRAVAVHAKERAEDRVLEPADHQLANSSEEGSPP